MKKNLSNQVLINFNTDIFIINMMPTRFWVAWLFCFSIILLIETENQQPTKADILILRHYVFKLHSALHFARSTLIYIYITPQFFLWQMLTDKSFFSINARNSTPFNICVFIFTDVSFFFCIYWIEFRIELKADMNSDKPLQTAAIFFISNFYLKQDID